MEGFAISSTHRELIVLSAHHAAELGRRHGIHQFLRPPLVDENLLGSLLPLQQASRQRRFVLSPPVRVRIRIRCVESLEDASTCSGVNGLALRSAAISVTPGKSA